MSQSFKDLFSGHSTDYSRFRPTYPDALFSYLGKECGAHDLCWDAGTGNGQAAESLSKYFQKVVGTDPSEKQIQQAKPNPKIEYRVGGAEASGLPDCSVDLVTVAQALHWIAHEKFWTEVKRVAKPGTVLAFWCYGLAEISPEIDAVVMRLYEDILGPYWEKERKLVEEGYRSVKVPFQELDHPKFPMSAEWTLEDAFGYLGTWSALQKYKKEKKKIRGS